MAEPAVTDREPVLEVRDLRTYFYQDGRVNRAIDGVSLALYPGRVLGIVGESGCGKSVTASSVMRLLPDLARIESGEILYRNHGKTVNIASYPSGSDEMRAIRGSEIAMIFQDPIVSLNPVYTVGWQIMEMLRLHRSLTRAQARTRAIELLAEMGIPSPEIRVDEFPHQFSGGMRQRAMIAMAMACEPRVLIADEPTTALDVTIQAQVFELIDRLRRDRDMATMLITHDMGVITEMADDVAVMYMGKVVETGTVADVLGSPRHPYTRALLASMPILGRGRRQQLSPIRGATPDAYNRPPGCQFAPRCDSAMPGCVQQPPVTQLSATHDVSCWLHPSTEGNDDD